MSTTSKRRHQYIYIYIYIYVYNTYSIRYIVYLSRYIYDGDAGAAGCRDLVAVTVSRAAAPAPAAYAACGSLPPSSLPLSLSPSPSLAPSISCLLARSLAPSLHPSIPPSLPPSLLLPLSHDGFSPSQCVRVCVRARAHVCVRARSRACERACARHEIRFQIDIAHCAAVRAASFQCFS